MGMTVSTARPAGPSLRASSTMRPSLLLLVSLAAAAGLGATGEVRHPNRTARSSPPGLRVHFTPPVRSRCSTSKRTNVSPVVVAVHVRRRRRCPPAAAAECCFRGMVSCRRTASYPTPRPTADDQLHRPSVNRPAPGACAVPSGSVEPQCVSVSPPHPRLRRRPIHRRNSL